MSGRLSGGGLSGWAGTPIDVERDIRAILERAGQADKSPAACKAWARELVTTIIPAWQPGKALSFAAAQRIGHVFERIAASACPSIAEATHRKTTKRGAERKRYTRRAS